MRFSIQGYRALTVATLKMYARNPLGVSAISLGLLVLMVAVHLLTVQGASRVKVALVDDARTSVAATLVRDIQAVPAFTVTAWPEATARRQLALGTVDVVVVIPADLGRRRRSGVLTTATVTVAYQAGAGTGLLLLRDAVNGFNTVMLHETPVVALRASSAQADLGFVESFLPGLLGFNIVQSGLVLAAGVFAGYRSSSILRRVQATGTAPATFVLAHATATFALGVAQVVVLLGVASALYPIRLNLAMLLLLTVVGYLVFLALGFALSGWIRDPQRGPAVATALALPLIFVGLFAPALPAQVAGIAGLLPIAFVTDGMRQLALGGSLSSVSRDLASLAVWAAVLLVAAARVFRWDAN